MNLFQIDERLINLKNEIENKKALLKEYDGQFYHVFFHHLYRF